MVPQTVGAFAGVPIFAAAIVANTASQYSGPVNAGGRGFTKYSFQLVGNMSATTISVSIYGTTDFGVIYGSTAANTLPFKPLDGVTLNDGVSGRTLYPAPGASGGDWFLVPGPALAGGTGTEANPLVDFQHVLNYNGGAPLNAVCAVATVTGYSSGSMQATFYASH